jgi:hypothetical protein
VRVQFGVQSQSSPVSELVKRLKPRPPAGGIHLYGLCKSVGCWLKNFIGGPACAKFRLCVLFPCFPTVDVVEKCREMKEKKKKNRPRPPSKFLFSAEFSVSQSGDSIASLVWLGGGPTDRPIVQCTVNVQFGVCVYCID